MDQEGPEQVTPVTGQLTGHLLQGELYVALAVMVWCVHACVLRNQLKVLKADFWHSQIPCKIVQVCAYASPTLVFKRCLAPFELLLWRALYPIGGGHLVSVTVASKMLYKLSPGVSSRTLAQFDVLVQSANLMAK